ncbi:Immunoglobulin-like domain [Trinorchestia longiramus]|nr:Immunoglobulin-like domain [Trinorchestia longiramus]
MVLPVVDLLLAKILHNREESRHVGLLRVLQFVEELGGPEQPSVLRCLGEKLAILYSLTFAAQIPVHTAFNCSFINPQFSSHGPHRLGGVVVDGLNPLDKTRISRLPAVVQRLWNPCDNPRGSLLSFNFLRVCWMFLMSTPMVLAMVLLSTSPLLSTRAMTTAYFTSASVNEISDNSAKLDSVILYFVVVQQWTLHLRYVQPRDAGEYICQLSTDPVMVYLIKLFVTEATSVIKGGGERYVHEGSSVRLECALQNHTQSPDYVFWYHNGTMINYDLNRKVKVEATADGSALTLLSVGRTDSGNYTCSPANAQFASIMLHIILGVFTRRRHTGGDEGVSGGAGVQCAAGAGAAAAAQLRCDGTAVVTLDI